MKEKLEGLLGGFGAILWYLFSVIYTFAPLFILEFPWWVDIIIIFAVMTIPVVGEIARFGLYIWAFIVVLNGPIDLIAIIFFVVFGLYVLLELVPFVMLLFSKNKS